MYKKNKLNKILAYTIIISMQLNTAAAYAAGVTVANGNTTVNNSGSAPVVNIAAPNANGLSHNKYTDFNVNNNGLVINNSAGATNNTLAGNIAGNANLGGRPANIILNEVVGTNPSHLNGNIQIAGQQAALIIANPNGISAAGVGFINTSRAVLTTGTPILDTNNNLQGFNVTNDSKISFANNADGFSISDTPRLDILSRAVEINGIIQAEQINIITGTNKINYADLSSEKLSAGSVAPSVALDVSALGGMYANRITMVGTETGVGVNSTGIWQASGNNSAISLTVDGKITLTQSSDPNITTSGTDLGQTGGIYSQGNITINTQQLHNAGELVAGISAGDPESDIAPSNVAGGQITINAQNITNTNHITNELGSINIATNNTLTNSGNIGATSLDITTNDLTNSGIIEHTGNTQSNIHITNTLNNTTGNIRSAGTLDILATTLNNSSGYINGANGLQLTATNINNSTNGAIVSQNGDTHINTNNINSDGGLIKAATQLNIHSTSDLNIDGNLTAGTDIRITSNGNITQAQNAVVRAVANLYLDANGKITNAGNNIAQGDITWTATDAENKDTGRISAQGQAIINTTNTPINHGKISGTNIQPIKPTPDTIPNYTAPDIGTSTADAPTGNFGGIVADPNANTNYKPIVEKTDNGVDIVFIASANSNGVSLNQYTYFDVANSGLILNNATEHTLTQLAGYVDLNYRIGQRPAQVIVNQVTGANPSNLLGYIEVAGHKASVVIANPNGIVVDNLGFINANQATLITGQANINGTLNNYQVTGDNITVTGKGLDAAGTNQLNLISKNILITAGIWADNASLIAGANTVDAKTLGIITNNSATQTANSIDINQSGGIYANSGINMIANDSGANIKNFGKLFAKTQDINIHTDNKLDQHGDIYAGRDLTISAGHDIYMSGTTQATNNLTIDTDTNIINSGHIGIDNGTLSLSALQNITQTGDIRLEQGNLHITTGGNIAQHGNIAAKQGNTYLAIGAESGQYGTIYSSGDIDWQSIGTIRQLGKLNSTTGSIRISVDNDLRQFGDIVANQDISIQSKHDIWNDGELIALANTNIINTRELLNTGNIAATNLNIDSGVNITQSGGTMIGSNNLVLNTQELTNDNGILFSARNIELIVQDKLENLNSSMIYSQGNISIHAADGRPTTLLRNQSSNIRADQDLDIQTTKLINEKREFVTGWDVTESDHVIPLPGFTPNGDNYDAKRFYHRVVQDGTIYIDSPAGYILAGNDINIHAQDIVNEYSFITAGHDLGIQADNMSNLSYKNIKITTDTGRDVIYWKYNVHRRLHLGCYTRYGQTAYPYYNQTRVNISGGADSVISASNITDIQVTGTTDNRLLDAAGDPITTGYLPSAQNPTANSPTIGTPTIDDLTNNNILIRPADISSKYLYEMDPRFTGYKNFLSSDYFLDRVLADPTLVGKRLGDGYVEQELIRQQMLNKTGQQYPDGYTDAESTYKYLMNNAIKYAQEFNLVPGIALTAEQMSKLTEDIVWFENREINGQTVLVPVLYLAATPARELLASGALITGRELNINTGELINTSGTLAATNNTNIHANNITNNYGTILAGKELNLTAQQNINHTSGIMQGQDINLTAGQNINLTTATATTQYQELTTTTKGNTAQVIASGNLNLTAGKDINLQGASALAEGNTTVKAGGDINLDTIQTGHSVTTAGDQFNYASESVRHQGSIIGGKDLAVSTAGDLNITGSHLVATDNANIAATGDINITNVKDSTLLDNSIGDRGGQKFDRDMNYDEQIKSGSISAGKDISIATGGDLHVQSGNIVSEKGKIDIAATGDINITADKEIHHSIREDKYTNVGILSTKTTTIYDEQYSSQHVASNISGEQISLSSNKDINITAGNVIADNDVKLHATGDVNINSAQDEYAGIYDRQEKTSGLFLSGGLGVTIGTREQKDQFNSTAGIATGSTIGSINSSVDIYAGKDINVQASDILAGQDINLSGQTVNIVDTDNRFKNTESHEFKQTGLTISLGGGTIDAITKVTAPIQRSNEVSDSRLQALYVAKAAQELKANGEVLNNAVKGDFNLAVNISIGTTKSSSTTTAQAATSQGSTLTAGEDINIIARDKDINIIGSNITGDNINLTAKDNVNIIAADNTRHTDNKSDSSSASLGVSVGIGKGSPVGVSLSGSIAMENGTEDIRTWTPGTVTAGNGLNITTGKDANIIGSQVAGDKVTANIGGNLNIESLQDTNKYNSDSQYAGVSIGIGGKDPGIQGSAGMGKIDSDYAAVNNQAGIYAGNQGFDITVAGNTDLTGAVIDSNATPDNNKLTTGTITFGDIQNSAEYSASNVGIGIDTRPVKNPNTNGSGTDKKDAGITPSISGTDGKADSTTKSAVAEGTIEITDKDKQQQDVAELSRDTDTAHNKLDPIFDKDKIMTQQELAKLFGEVGFTLVGQIKSNNKWDSNDPRTIALHAVIGGFMAQLNGGSFLEGMSVAALNKLIVSELAKMKNDKGKPLFTGAELRWISATVGATVSKVVGGNTGQGAGIADSATTNNSLNEELAAQHEKNPIGVTEKDTKSIVEANNSNIVVPSYAVEVMDKIPANHNIAEGEFMTYTFSGSIAAGTTSVTYLVDSYGNVYKGVNIEVGVGTPGVAVGVQKGYLGQGGSYKEDDVKSMLTGTSFVVNSSLTVSGGISINDKFETTKTTGVTNNIGISAGVSYFEHVGKLGGINAK